MARTDAARAGGFDPAYAPAWFEDTIFASIASAVIVVYDPAVVIHLVRQFRRSDAAQAQIKPCSANATRSCKRGPCNRQAIGWQRGRCR
jgi:hypothetical protein